MAFKQANRLTEQMSEMQAEIQSIGTFNVQKKKEALQKLFVKWYPQVNAFENQLKPYASQLEILVHNERIMEHQANRTDDRMQKAEREVVNLSQQLLEYQEFVESIPKGILEELVEQYEGEEQVLEEEQTQTF